MILFIYYSYYLQFKVCRRDPLKIYDLTYHVTFLLLMSFSLSSILTKMMDRGWEKVEYKSIHICKIYKNVYY